MKRTRTATDARAFTEGGFFARGTLDPTVALSIATTHLHAYELGNPVNAAARPPRSHWTEPTPAQVTALGDYLHELLAAARPGFYRIVPARPDDPEYTWHLHTARSKGHGAFEGVQFPAEHELQQMRAQS